MAYLTLYRAFRPERFSDVVEQSAIVTALRRQVSAKRISHAYLFCGSRGTGKTTLAKLFARAVNCQNPQDGEPCGVCASCIAISDETTLDVNEIDAASNNGVDDVRALREQVKYPPSDCKYKVYIVDEAHMLSGGAFNALLKTLEEPPEYVVFILATTEPQRLPATILSRCQRYDFARISVDGIVKRLRIICESQGADAEDAALKRIARAAQGGMRDAISTLDACISGGDTLSDARVRDMIGASDDTRLRAITDALIKEESGSALIEIDRAFRAGADLNMLTRDVAAYLRAMLLAMACGEDYKAVADALEMPEDQAQALINETKNLPRGRILRAADIFIGAEADMKWASQPRFILELCVVRATQPKSDLDISALLQRIESLETAPRPAAIQKRESISVRDKIEKPAAAKASANTDDERYKAAIDIAKKRDPAIQGFLRALKFTGVENGQATITYTDADQIFVNALSRADKVNTLTESLTQAFGAQVAPKYVKANAQNAPQASQLKNAVMQGAALFGIEPEIFKAE